MEQFEHVACTVCGCVCDDLRITVEEGRISKCEGACRPAEPWFLGQGSSRPSVALIDGQPAPLDAAVVQAADILRATSSPLIYGLSRSSTDGQRAAIALGERIGATIDRTASLCHAPSVVALQEVGEVTCTLGEVKNRADLVIFWGSNPVESHPRHFERYSLLPKGQFIPGGRADRYTRFCARRMRIPGDVTGADMVLAWQTGYPFSVNLARGYPRYNPGEFSAQEMLEREEVDACLLVGSEGVARFSEQASAYLRRIPTIALDYPTVESLIVPTIRFTTAVYGIHQPGTAYRMDGIPIPLRAFLPTDYPSDCEVLKLIADQFTEN